MKLNYYVITLAFLLFIFLLGLFTIVTPDREVSKLENRVLAQLPSITKQALVTGEWFQDFEDYFTDQFFKRDSWVELYTAWEMKINKTFVNGYHVTNDNWILAQPSNSFNKEELDISSKNINQLGEVLKNHGTQLYYFPMPAKVYEMAELLPSYVPRGRGKENTNYLLSRLDNQVVNSVNVSELLEKEVPFEKRKNFYFKTDHHWNIKGAFFGFKSIVEEIGRTQPIKKEIDIENEYKYTCVKGKELIGSWNRNLHMLVNSGEDQPCYYVPKHFTLDKMEYYLGAASEDNRVEYTDYYATGVKKAAKKMEFHDMYANNYAELNIINDDSTNDIEALLIKDSYANPLVPHISSLFKKTTVFDPRYDKKRTVMDLVNSQKFDIVIILYNSNNLTGAMYDFHNPAK